MKNEELKTASAYIKKHRLQKRWQKVVTGLAAVVVFSTTYALILPAITLEKEPDKQLVCTAEKLNLHEHTSACYDADGNLVCGYADFVVHTHNDDCYDKDGNLVCTLPEIAAHTHSDSCYAVKNAHTHTDDCYTTERGELICTQEESEGHQHTEDCYDENGALICTLEESEGHQHTDDCYAWNNVLTCGMDETEGEEKELICGRDEIILHEHTEDCYAPDGRLTCGKQQVLEHVHGDACFETVVEQPEETAAPKCGKEEDAEHTHSLACYSDPNADIETAADWEKTFSDVKLTGVWADDLVAVAKTQLGYTESADNYEVEADGTTKRGYTRYGAWYGMPYGDWCAMFIDFCLNYADISGEYFPCVAGCELWIEQLSGAAEGYESFDLYKPADSGYIPAKGDIIFFDTDNDDTADHVGIVSEYIAVTAEEAESGLKPQIKTIEGNLCDAVAEAAHDADDETILGYAALPENPNPPEETGETTIEYTAEDGAVFTATGNLPEGAYLVALPLTDEQMTYIKENLAALGEDTAAFAYDIKIYDAEGNELKLTDSVKIRITGLALDENASVTGYHLTDVDADMLATVPAEEVTVEEVDVTTEENSLSFNASDFSVYYGIMTLASTDYPTLTYNNKGDAKVNSINVSIDADGTAPFDDDSNAGNDQNAHNRIVRSYDTVRYEFFIETTSQNVYGEARVKLTFTLNVPQGKAAFDTGSMRWMDTTEGYEPKITYGTKVVRRTIEGRIWLDVNRNGIQDEGEENLPEDLTVYLDKMDENGKYVQLTWMSSGMQMSVREGRSKASVYESGLYKFTDLEPGTYQVRFGLSTIAQNNQTIKFAASPYDQGSDDTKDSDGVPYINPKNGLLYRTTITGIEMPKAESIDTELYESKYHDSGFYYKSYELPSTGGEGTVMYTVYQ